MNIIKSFEWEQLASCIKKESSDTVNHVFDFLVDETARYELGETSYPRVDFAIAIALDRKKNPPSAVVSIKEDEPSTLELSPKSRRERIRHSWIQRFEEENRGATDKQLIQPDSDSSELEQKPLSKHLVRKTITRRRIVKKSESSEPS